jgi:hypothetical protein
VARIKYWNEASQSWEYADKSLKIDNNLLIDNTLTIEGRAADAKAVGEALSEKQPKGNYLTEHQDISGKLDADKLPEAINTALAQAKESGEFNGKDGVSATHSWNGTTLTVTSASGSSSADLKGPKGDKGETGSPGVWTKSEAPTDDSYTVWIDPDGEADDIDLSEQITAVVNTVLEEAKESGEFDGKTPARGTDYWTSADIAEIKSYVDEAILGGAW